MAHRTAYHALRSVARVQPGEWVVVLGAAGGVGLAAVELATVLGARVVAAASSAEKLALCLERGAEWPGRLHHRGPEGADQGASPAAGADVVVDPVGGPTPSRRCGPCAGGAGSSPSGFASGEIPRIPLNLVLLKGVVVTGFTMEGFARHQAEDRPRDLAELAELARAGRRHPAHLGHLPPGAGWTGRWPTWPSAGPWARCSWTPTR